MTDVLEEPALASKWWAIALTGGVVVCIATAAASGADAGDVALTAGLLLAYLAFFLLVVRRVAAGSVAAWVAVVVTIVVAGACVVVVPSNAILQFWLYPLLWSLLESVRASIVATFVAAAAIFAGFGIAAGPGWDWMLSAALTQLISYAVNVVLGLWITRIYLYAEERERLLGELTAAQDELGILHRDAGTTAERERLSRELHDTIAQTLAGTVLLAQRARRERAADALDDDTLALLEESARSALAETRALVAGSAPVELRGGGLAEALRALAARFARETPIAVEVDADAVALDREREVALLRCAQEALSNVRRHAGARVVRVSLTSVWDAVELRVQDDGRGFDPAAPADGFGLDGLRARLALIGGELHVTQDPTTVVATVPAGAAA